MGQGPAKPLNLYRSLRGTLRQEGGDPPQHGGSKGVGSSEGSAQRCSRGSLPTFPKGLPGKGPVEERYWPAGPRNFPCSEYVDGEEVQRAGSKQPWWGGSNSGCVGGHGGPCLRIPGLLRWGERTGEQVHLPPGGCGQRCPGGLALWLSGVRSVPPQPREILWGTTGENCYKNLGSSGALPGPSRRDCWWGKERVRGTDSCRAQSDTKVRGWEEGGGLPRHC